MASVLANLRLNIAIDDDGTFFSNGKILVRKKIQADGLNDELLTPATQGTTWTPHL